MDVAEVCQASTGAVGLFDALALAAIACLVVLSRAGKSRSRSF